MQHFSPVADLMSRLTMAAVAIATFTFLRWLIPFVFARLDVGAAALGRQMKELKAELDRYRDATMLLVNELALKDPANPVLREAARILRSTPTRPSMEVDEIVSGLAKLRGSKQ